MRLLVPAEIAGLTQVNCKKALGAGLRFRPLFKSFLGTPDWDKARPADIEYRAGLAPQRETELLATWHNGG